MWRIRLTLAQEPFDRHSGKLGSFRPQIGDEVEAVSENDQVKGPPSHDEVEEGALGLSGRRYRPCRLKE